MSSVEIRSVGQEAGAQRLIRWAQTDWSTIKVSESGLLRRWSPGALGTVGDSSPLAAAGRTLERSQAHPTSKKNDRETFVTPGLSRPMAFESLIRTFEAELEEVRVGHKSSWLTFRSLRVKVPNRVGHLAACGGVDGSRRRGVRSQEGKDRDFRVDPRPP